MSNRLDWTISKESGSFIATNNNNNTVLVARTKVELMRKINLYYKGY